MRAAAVTGQKECQARKWGAVSHPGSGARRVFYGKSFAPVSLQFFIYKNGEK